MKQFIVSSDQRQISLCCVIVQYVIYTIWLKRFMNHFYQWATYLALLIGSSVILFLSRSVYLSLCPVAISIWRSVSQFLCRWPLFPLLFMTHYKPMDQENLEMNIIRMSVKKRSMEFHVGGHFFKIWFFLTSFQTQSTYQNCYFNGNQVQINDFEF